MHADADVRSLESDIPRRMRRDEIRDSVGGAFVPGVNTSVNNKVFKEGEGWVSRGQGGGSERQEGLVVGVSQ